VEDGRIVYVRAIDREAVHVFVCVREREIKSEREKDSVCESGREAVRVISKGSFCVRVSR
jgi:hypothetical protein